MRDDIRKIHTAPVFVVLKKPSGVLSVPDRGPDKQFCVVNRIKIKFPDSISQNDTVMEFTFHQPF